MDESLARLLKKVARAALAVGLGCLAGCLVGALLDPAQFFRSWLLGFVFWTGLAFGCFAVLMLYFLVGGRWGLAVRRCLESGSRTFPLMALCFVPLLFGLRELYPWSRPEAAADEVLRHQQAYLNVPFFVGRAAVYFALWTFLAALMNRWSRREDRTGEPAPARKMVLLSGPGLVAYGLTIQFASVDWVMSLEPRWYSTIFGMLFMAGQALAALSLVTATTIVLARKEPLRGAIPPVAFKDLGNLLLTFVILWTYMSFAQFLIIWSGNLKEEIPWYARRYLGSWSWVGLALIVLHFFVPLFLLLFRETKRRTSILLAVAVGILVMRLVDLEWMTAPEFREEASVRWLDLLAPLGIGGIWMALYAWDLSRRPFLPPRALHLEEAS
jgi:hypothetical protein